MKGHVSHNQQRPLTGGSTVSKTLIIIALCANASRSTKIKAFVIGSIKKPRCFKNLNSEL
ncbi:MAG: hypothetical protein MHPSP_002508, partial [Paramarteilia canceri]